MGAVPVHPGTQIEAEDMAQVNRMENPDDVEAFHMTRARIWEEERRAAVRLPRHGAPLPDPAPEIGRVRARQRRFHQGIVRQSRCVSARAAPLRA